MTYSAIKMTGKVYVRLHFNLKFDIVDIIEGHIEQGNVVVICDDLEEIAGHFDVELEDLITVD